jgi:phospholipid/cholesterol/gamma-HCH transport system substrate-binding protein
MRFTGRQRIRFFALMALIVALGTASLGYVLLNQRLNNPLVETYRIEAELPEADGVVGGLGQPVNVAGVKVGSVVDSRLAAGRARITIEIERDLLPRVHRGAAVSLEPITPLKDMQVELEPGDPNRAALRSGELIGVASNTSPVPLSNLLSSLDADTRTYLRALIESVGAGSKGTGPDMRATFRAMAPTTEQVRRITASLDARRTELARLVTNLGKVTAAASRDDRLATLVAAGDETLRAVASEDRSLDAALRKLPRTLDATRAALDNAGEFSDQLGPALAAIRPAVRHLPRTFASIEPFARASTRGLRGEIRPLIRKLQPVAGNLGAPLTSLTEVSPKIWETLQSLRFGLNALAYNPPGRDEGGLFWTDWFFHNANSAFGSVGDAHGRSARSIILANCQQWAGLSGDVGTVLQIATGVSTICPVTKPPASGP